MNLVFRKTTCRVLVASVLVFSFHTAHAGLIGAEQTVAPAMSAERSLVLATLDHAEVVAQLQAAGVDPVAARERIRGMSEQEVQDLARDIQSAPAGGVSDWAWVVVILVGALVWYYAIRK